MNITLTQWLENSTPDQRDPSYQWFLDQTNFINNEIAEAIFREDLFDKNDKCCEVSVIADYAFRNIKLPVYQITTDEGAIIRLLNYSYGWKVSVLSEKNVVIETNGFFDPTEEVDPSRCKGMPSSIIFGSYAKNNKRFTVALDHDKMLYAFLWVLSIALGLRTAEQDG